MSEVHSIGSIRESKKLKCKSKRGRDGKFAVSHGHCKNGRATKIYSIWEFMNQRCYDSGHVAFKHYGGRGIKVCDRWRGPNGFTNFLADMGERPEGKSLDRIDNNGNYEPGNCRWATPIEQSRNRRSTRMMTYKGQTKSIPEWAEEYGLTYSALLQRLVKCGSLEKSLAYPLQTDRHRPRKKLF